MQGVYVGREPSEQKKKILRIFFQWATAAHQRHTGGYTYLCFQRVDSNVVSAVYSCSCPHGVVLQTKHVRQILAKMAGNWGGPSRFWRRNSCAASCPVLVGVVCVVRIARKATGATTSSTTAIFGGSTAKTTEPEIRV